MKQSHTTRLRPIRTVSWPLLLLGVICHGLNMEVVDGLLELCVQSRLSLEYNIDIILGRRFLHSIRNRGDRS